MKWAPGMRFRFAGNRANLGTFTGLIGIVTRRVDREASGWWFTLEDHNHPDYTPEPRWNVNECYMEPVYPEHGWPSVEQADAWLDAYTVEES